MDSLIHTVIETVAQHAMLPPNAPALVMVSGGGDSVTMLRLLASGVLGDNPLRALHINHGLRGEASEADETFVRELCAGMDIESRVVRFDVAGYAAAEKLNLEDAGRRVRHRFAAEELDAWCGQLGREPGEGRIVVAHTRDDRIETFFMRAIAGSGTGALAGIASTRGRVVRPLIDCDRADVRAWLEDSGQPRREDESNQDLTRTRAFVRSRIVPSAEELNPAFRTVLARTMDLIAADDAVLTQLAQTHVREVTHIDVDDRIVFQVNALLALGPAMARRVVRAAVLDAFEDASRLEFSHIDAVAQGLGDPSFARDLSWGLRAVSEYGSMVISRREVREVFVAPTLLSLPGTADMGPVGTMRAQTLPTVEREGGPLSVVIDAATIGGDLIVDRWRVGDRMRPLGMTGTRKLSDMLIDAKVPRRNRGAVPVVRDGESIVWLAGVRMAEQYRVTDSTAHAVRLTWSPGRGNSAP